MPWGREVAALQRPRVREPDRLECESGQFGEKIVITVVVEDPGVY